MPLIKGGGTTTTMVGSKKSIPPIDRHLMVIKLNKVNNINLFIKTILLSWRTLSINPCIYVIKVKAYWNEKQIA